MTTSTPAKFVHRGIEYSSIAEWEAEENRKIRAMMTDGSIERTMRNIAAADAREQARKTPAQLAAHKKTAARDAATKPNPSDGNTNPTSKESAMSKTTANDTAEHRQSAVHTIADLKIPAWITESLTPAQLDQVADPILEKLNAKRVDPQFAKLNAERNALHMLHFQRNVRPGLDHNVPDWCLEDHHWRYHEASGTATRYLGIANTGSTTTGVSAEASATQHDDGTLDFTVMIDCDPKATPADLRQFAADLVKLADEYEQAQIKAGRDD